MGDENIVGDMQYQMQKFSWVDYVVFVFMLAISACVGVYWGFFKKQSTQNDYLLGGRNMKVIPVSMSLVASFVSGITLLGSPTEVYMYGTQYGYIMGGIFLMSIVMTQVYLPVFHELKITSNYEQPIWLLHNIAPVLTRFLYSCQQVGWAWYGNRPILVEDPLNPFVSPDEKYLSMRFDNRVRLFGSILFAITLIGWLPIVIYVPALAFNQVTGVDIHIITPIVCLVCIFYTSAGGLQAVVWTDVIQITAMVGAMALVAIKGTFDVGGVGAVWQRNWESGRIEAPNWDPRPTARHTIWNLVFGGLIYWLQANAVNQTMVQRYLALPTLRGAKWAVVFFCIGISIIYCFCLYCGLLIYARFHDCDPLQTKLAKAKDQLLPLLVMDVLGGIPGLPGIFIAGIFSAALSSLSTSLNSMSAVVLEDFYKPFYKRRLTDRQTNWLLKSVVIFLGALSLGLVFVVEKMGTILQLTMTLEAMTMGPQLGVFSMGILMPWVDATGALVGGIIGLIIMAWWCLSAQLAIARGLIVHPHKHLTTEGCQYNFTAADTVVTPNISAELHPVLHVSYMWYTFAGAFMTIFAGVMVSKLIRWWGAPYVPPAPKLLAPQLRRLYKEPPHPSDEPFIRAYGNKDNIPMNSASINLQPISERNEIS